MEKLPFKSIHVVSDNVAQAYCQDKLGIAAQSVNNPIKVAIVRV